MKRILGVVGSPRRNGNTLILVAKILEGAKTAGAATELLFLKELQIQQCDGCHACRQGKPCSKKDDMNRIYGKIISSDAIVFGTPVYWYGPTALMKAFLDRLVYFNCIENRVKIRGKSAVLAVPFEETKPETAALLVTFFEECFHYLEMKLTGKILVGGVSQKGDVRTKTDRLQEACELGRRPAR